MEERPLLGRRYNRLWRAFVEALLDVEHPKQMDPLAEQEEVCPSNYRLFTNQKNLIVRRYRLERVLSSYLNTHGF